MVCCDIDASIMISFVIKTNDRSHSFEAKLTNKCNVFPNNKSCFQFVVYLLNNNVAIIALFKNTPSLLQLFTSAISRSKLTEEQNNAQNCEIMLPITTLLRLKCLNLETRK